MKPKSFIPNKDPKNIEKLLEKTTLEKIELALEDYIGKREHTDHIHKISELVQFIKGNNMNSYVRKLNESQLEGKLPVIRVLSTYHEGMTQATYDLYWKPEKEKLEFDWDDTPGAVKRYWEIKH